ncbi:MerR family transcriptional regulator [Aquipseudomonas alcaligenes]|nr:MerR family transcriptional regulator [Pseudomonas alcaligenes]
MKIGELGKQADCQVETIRYYEREGLLPVPGRSEGNYRVYGKEHLERLVFIRNCRTLDRGCAEFCVTGVGVTAAAAGLRS